MYQGIVNIFREINDPRRGNAIIYDLAETLVIAVLAILCGMESFVEMEMFGNERESWLRKFLKLERGIPSHDTFGDIFAALDPEAFGLTFAKWVETLRKKICGEVVALDGKTIRASMDTARKKKAVHIVSAWAISNRLVLGQAATEEKSNEITAIPQLLEMLEIGYMSALSEKFDESIEVMEIIEASKRLYGLAKFTFHAISDGLAEIFSKSYVGIRSFLRKPVPSLQLSLFPRE